MILEKQTEGLILEEGTGKSTAMEIDADSHIFLMRMLSKFYSDGVGSLIRETASNALDSHRQSGVTEPIIVSLQRNSGGTYEFSVEDFGLGIDDVVVENVIKKYGKSTKRNDAKALGAFGLGFKSPLAYSPSFCFVGRKNGIERKWMMYEGEEDENKIDLLYEKPTTERNGVKIIVPVKHNDYYNFHIKIKEQLAYFEHVYFDVEGISNDFSIVRNEHFQWSPLCNDTYIHICLDNVYYPIDWAKLGLSDDIQVPVGLRFSLSDGIFPLPNRETIKYTEEARKTIISKIKKVADYFVEKYNESITTSKDIRAIFDFLSSGVVSVPSYNGGKWPIVDLLEHSSVALKKPVLEGIKHLDLERLYTMRDSLLKCYRRNYDYRRGRFSNNEEKGYTRDLNWYSIDEKIYVSSEAIPKQKKDYLRDQLKNDYAIFVKFSKEFPLKSIKNEASYTSILNLKAVPKKLWRAHIQEFQYVRNLITSKFISVDKIDIPKQWLDDRKKKRVALLVANGTNTRRKKLVGEVTGKEAKKLERYVSGKNCKFEPVIIKMPEAHKNKRFTIYCRQNQEEKVQKWFTVLKEINVRFVVFSDRELKNLKDVQLHNWMSMDEFEKGKHKIFKRSVTAYLINDLITKNNQTFSKFHYLEQISKSLNEKLKAILKYRNDFHIRGDETLYKDMVAVAEDNNLFDNGICPLYKEVKMTLEKLPFLETLCKIIPYGTHTNPDIVSTLKDLFKYYKMRIDWVHYKVTLNEETTEGALTEGELEELEETV